MGISKPLHDARILVIDDEATNLLVIKELLEEAGFEHVYCEEDPILAIEHYQNMPFDLVLLDLNMPKKSGFEVLDAFKKIDAAIPPLVLVLTAFGDQTTKIRALTSGASDFLAKPFDLDEVLSRVNNLIHLHFSQDQLFSQNELLEQKVKQRTQELHEANLDVINRLGVVADYRDTDTAQHAKRVGRVSQILARALDLGDVFCERLLHAAPLHDIGKIGIPDSILLKPGKLEPDEWVAIKQHSEIGAKILENSPTDIIQMAHEIALTHHEKWDGTGYPQGLKGEEIPISGRVVIVADVFDALSFDRPYKAAWTHDKIKAFMDEKRGIMFDTNVIDQFMEHFDEIVIANK